MKRTMLRIKKAARISDFLPQGTETTTVRCYRFYQRGLLGDSIGVTG